MNTAPIFWPPNHPAAPACRERAVELEEFGIRNNPDEWRLYYNEGFIRYMELQDYAGAAEAFARGAKVPNAHPFLAVLAGRMAEHAGDQQMARMMWSTSYQTTKDKNVRANAAAHLRALQVDEDVTNLEALTETLPTADRTLPFQLRRTGGGRSACAARPATRSAITYKLMPDGRVELRHTGRFSLHPEGYASGIRTAARAQVSTLGLSVGASVLARAGPYDRFQANSQRHRQPCRARTLAPTRSSPFGPFPCWARR